MLKHRIKNHVSIISEVLTEDCFVPEKRGAKQESNRPIHENHWCFHEKGFRL